MVGGILHADLDFSFVILIRFGEFFDTLFCSRGTLRQALHVTGLSGAARACQPVIVHELAELG